ncbi:hypothetical protein SAMN04488128_1011089 [Chitinophaga eiseniae]|uniref:DUF2946 domain-containing protein n=1 Tax=Chitinophaga eiseniae TaxID=634771 RepID=A0A1T4MFP3_9BACT|nr:hypothetical protein [Chitinophaga eiseniae]SJZ65677.1 hypothetical protein SAMN04488128_1011089 [Chitinophaga eiseniae]
MHPKPFDITRRLLAFLLMALLVFVQMVKLFHHHPANGQGYMTLHHGLQVQTSHACDICDFQLAKDATVPDFLSTPQLLSTPYITPSLFTADGHPGVQSVQTGRGPPSA